jgi:hypothetical protein
VTSTSFLSRRPRVGLAILATLAASSLLPAAALPANAQEAPDCALQERLSSADLNDPIRGQVTVEVADQHAEVCPLAN